MLLKEIRRVITIQTYPTADHIKNIYMDFTLNMIALLYLIWAIFLSIWFIFSVMLVNKSFDYIDHGFYLYSLVLTQLQYGLISKYEFLDFLIKAYR